MNYIFSKKVPEVGDRGFIIGNRFIPIHGIKSKMPTDGLVFYESLKNIGTLSALGNPTFTKVDDVPCFYTDGNDGLYCSTPNINLNGSFSISFWCRGLSDDGIAEIYFGKDTANNFMMWSNENNVLSYGTSGSAGGKIINFSGNVLTEDKWHHVCVIRENNQLGLYIDAVLKRTDSWSINIIDEGYFCIGCGRWNNQFTYFGTGYISSVRLYNKSLTQDEINLLCSEFKTQNKYIKDGLIFWASLNGKTPNVAETGQDIVVLEGTNPTYTTYQNVPCLYSDNNVSVCGNVYVKDIDPYYPKTLSFWMNLTDATGSNEKFFVNMVGAGGVGYYLSNNSDVILQRANSSSGYYRSTVLSNIQTNQWYHVLLTDDGTDAKTYINGSLVNTLSVGGYRKTALDCLFGLNCTGVNNETQYNFTGYISSVRVYNRVLTQSEITKLTLEFKI